MPTLRNPFLKQRQKQTVQVDPQLQQPAIMPQVTMTAPAVAQQPTPGPGQPAPVQPVQLPPTIRPPIGAQQPGSTFDINNPQPFLDALTKLPREQQHSQLQEALLGAVSTPEQFGTVFGSDSPLEDLSNALFGNSAIRVFQQLGELPRPGGGDPLTFDPDPMRALNRIRAFLGVDPGSLAPGTNIEGAPAGGAPLGAGGGGPGGGFGGGPGGGGGGGGPGGGGGGGGGPGGGLGGTPAGPFPFLRDPTLDPNQFNPAVGAPPAQGIDFGTSPFSQMIESGLAGVIGAGGAPLSPFAQQTREAIGAQLGSLAQRPGGTGETAQGTISDLIRGGVSPDESVINRSIESLIEGANRLRRSQTATLGSELASRGIAGSGLERTGLEELEREIGSGFATALRDIGTGELTRARGTFERALGLGEAGRQFDIGTSADLLGLAQGAAAADQPALLQALSQGTGRQGLLSDIALQMTEQNRLASQFAAQFGLSREQALRALQLMPFQNILPLLGNLLQGAGIAQRGSV